MHSHELTIPATIYIKHLIVHSEKEPNGLKFNSFSNQPPVIIEFRERVNQPLKIYVIYKNGSCFVFLGCSWNGNLLILVIVGFLVILNGCWWFLMVLGGS